MANSKLARSLRVKLQLRDKKGRWIEMGKGGKWLSFDGQMKSGIVIGSKGNKAIIREKNADGTLGGQNVEVDMGTLEMIPSKASLDPQTLQLMNEYKQGQSAKGKKEADARQQALSNAMAAEGKGQAVQDEVEVEYEASAAEELEDVLNDAPQGAMLLKNDAVSKHTLQKNAKGEWTDGVAAPVSSSTLANSPGTKDYAYVGSGDIATKANGLLKELAGDTAAPVKEKKGWFGKKKKKEEGVDPLDAIIQSTNEMLGLPNNSQNQNQNQNQNQETAPPAAAVPEAATPEAVEEVAVPEAVEEAPSPDALIDISAWKYHQGTQGGSNPGGVYTDTEGKQHYVKKSKSDMHAKNEVLADKFYEKLGVKTSKLKLADVGNGKLGTASEMVPGSKNDFYSKANSDEAYKKKFQEDFAIDAWLANWDVVGLEYDNALTDANGDPIRIDPGGALLYRAMGSPKGDMFGPEVGEWDSMRKGSNPASKIFGSMSDEDLKNSVAKLKNISDEDVAAIVDSMEFEPDVADYLKNTLAARRQNLLNKFPELANEQGTNEEQSLPEEPLETPVESIPEAPEQTAKPEPISEAPETPEAIEETPEAPAAVTEPQEEALPAEPVEDIPEPAPEEATPEAPETPEAVSDVPEAAVPEATDAPQTEEDSAPVSEENTTPAPESTTPAPEETTPAPEAAPVVPDAVADEGEEIPIINGAKAMLSQMAKDQGISLDQLQKDLGLPADGAFPNKGKTVTNDKGDVFEANSIVSNPKFGEGIASIILPSTNSVKVLYAGHGFKVTQAKNLNLVNGTAPQEVASKSVDLSGATPGDVGINSANGKMYFVDKGGNAKYVGDDVEYTKKGVTQQGKIASIYKGTKTAKVEWEDGTASVKKASQLSGKEDSSNTSEESTSPAPQEETAPVATEEAAPEAAEEAPAAAPEPAPAEAPEAPEAPEDSTTPAPETEPAEEATAPLENKGWTPKVIGEYDKMGPSDVQIHGDMTTATVYAHDNSGVEKEAFNLTNKVGYNPIEEKFFGTGQNLQPLYEGDKVEYLFTGKKYKGEIIEVKLTSQSAVVLLEDGTKKLKKFSQLSGNHPKQVPVDEDGNYTDWHGNAAQIPNFKGSESAPEEATPEAPETPEATKPEWGDIMKAQLGQVVQIGDKSYARVGGSYLGEWWDAEDKSMKQYADLFNSYHASDDVSMSEVPSPNLFAEDLDELGTKAKISSNKLGVELLKDSDGDWYHSSVGYVDSEKLVEKMITDDWVIDSVGDEKPAVSLSDLEEKSPGQVLTIGDKNYYKVADDNWWSASDGMEFDPDDMVSKIENKSDTDSVRFGEVLSPNLSEDELSDMKKGAEIHSEKLGLTLEKDGDGDWTGYGLGYYSDDILDSFVSDDWVVNSTGNVEPNYSSYDLDSANSYSELYSSNLDESFTKDVWDSTWTSSNSGSAFTSEELLEEFPTDDWSLSESEIDDSYSYGMGAENFSGLYPGSKLQHTEAPHDAPETYVKIADDKWVPTDYSGEPKLDSAGYSDDSFEDGYTHIDHEAEEGEYEAPRLIKHEPNTPDIGKDDTSLEWFENAPVGTAVKTSLSDKFLYIKGEDGKWASTNMYGKSTSSGTSQQMVDATNGKHDLTDIYMPESSNSEEASPEEGASKAEDLEVGTFISQDGATDTGFTKVGDNQWKMKSGDQEIDHVLGDDFINAYQEATGATPAAPTPESENSADPAPLPDDSVDIGEPVPSGKKIEDLPSVTWMLPVEFDALPVGTKMHNDDNGYTYEKVSIVGPDDWIAYKYDLASAAGTAKFDSATFHGILHMPDIAGHFKLEVPENTDTSDTSDTPTPETGKTYPAKTGELTNEEFKNLPVGSVLSPGWTDTTYTKTGDNQWTSSDTGSELTDDNFDYYVNTNDNPLNLTSDGISLTVPDSSETSTPMSKNLYDLTEEELINAPVGSTVKHDDDTSFKTLTKSSEGLWKSSDPSAEEETTEGLSWLLGKQVGKKYTFTAGNGEEPKSSYPDDLAGFNTTDEFDKLPIGTTIGTPQSPATYTKTGINEWTTEHGKKKEDLMFHYLVESEDTMAGIYKVFVPKDGVALDNTTPDTTADKPMTGMTLNELENAPVGSTLTHVGDGYNSGTILTKDEDGAWVSNQNGQANDTSEGLQFFADNPEFGDKWIFHNADGSETPASAPEKPKTLADIGESEFENFPTGTKLTLHSTVLTKKEDGDWSSNSGTIYTNPTIAGLHSDPDSSKEWIISPADGNDDSQSPYTVGNHKSVKMTPELADGYPVGTVIKQESPYYSNGKVSPNYYVKKEDGSWQHYKQTEKTLSAKTVYTSTLFNNWGFSSTSVSVPKAGDHFISNTGELGYVGDWIDYDGSSYKVSKIMKTGVKLTDGNNTITVKPQKLSLGTTFGIKEKPNSQSTQSNVSSNTSAPTSTSDDVVEPSYDINTSDSFAGASADEYNAQGLVTPVMDKIATNVSVQLIPSAEPDKDHPLFGAPQPEAPASATAYPPFKEPELDLPEWESEAWLAKVEQRYLDNPKKAKNSVQESNKWSAIQSVLKGDKSNLDGLLSSMYLDEELYSEAKAGIDAKTAENAPLIADHKTKIEDAKKAYDVAKASHIANYTELKAQYEADLLAWMSANPDPSMMTLPQKPALSQENFTGGAADWSKSHIGTYTAEAVFSSIKTDNAVGRHGLSIATDSDSIESLDVSAFRIIGTDGEEKLDFRFGVTKDYGNVLHTWIQNQPNVKKSSKIYTPHLALNTATGLNKEQVGSNQNTTGHRYEYTHEATGAKIIFQRAYNEEEFNNDNNHNKVRIVMPKSTGPAEYQAVLEHLGISAKPASEGDIRVLSENKLIQAMSSGKNAISDNNLKGAARKKALAEIEKEFGVTPENVVFRADVNGKVMAFFDADTTKKLSDRYKNIKVFQHNLSSSSDLKMWESLLTGSHPGLLSTYNRWSNGVGFSGMSSSKDLQEGSGDSPFLTPMASDIKYGHGVLGIHPSSVFQHLDLWANSGDFYGKKNQGSYGTLGPFKLVDKLKDSFHEICVRNGVPLSDLSYIVLDSHMKTQIIAMLKKKGVLKINGFSLEDFFISDGQNPQKADYIPGFGVVPAGTTLEQALSDPSFGGGGADAGAVGGGPAI